MALSLKQEKIMINKVENQSDVMVVGLQGALEVSLQQTLKSELEKVAAQQSDLVLDFSEVSFIDSSCLGALVSLTKVLRAERGDIKIVHLNDDVRSIFQITRLDRIFEIFDDTNTAVESYYRD